jgi:uncharacterized protein YggE
VRTAVALAAAGLLAAGCTGDTADGGSDAVGVGGGGPSADGAAVAAAGPGGWSVPAAGITVEGTGRISGRPDTLTVTVGVEVERPAVDEAIAAANEGAQAVIDAVTGAGVDADDVQTARLEVYPRYDDGPGRSEPTIAGYTVTNLLEVTVRDIDAAGEVLGAATDAAGGDARVQGVRFGLEDNQGLVDQARERAFEDARARAQDYAELAGRELGAVVSIAESFTPAGPIEQFAEAGGLDVDTSGAAVPIQPGQQEVQVRVTTVWSFE